MRNRKSSLMLLPVLMFLGFARAHAIPVPILDLAALTRDSDLIVVGQIANVWEEKRTSILTEGKAIPARQMLAQLQVERVLKGQLRQQDFSFRFVIADFSAYKVISSSRFGLFFLRKASQQNCTVTNPFYPFVVAAMDAPIHQGGIFDNVIAEVANVLTQSNASVEDRIEAINALKEVKDDAAAAALRQVAEQPDVELRLRAVAALLWRNDFSVMKIAEDALFNPPPNIDKQVMMNLAVAIEGIKDSRAIPNLTRLLDAREILIRRSAASALRHTGSPDAIGALAKALDDNDRDVRYYAVMGLAEITGQNEWGPSTDLFRLEEQRYLSFWKDWVKTKQ
jgi:HEAT repeats